MIRHMYAAIKLDPSVSASTGRNQKVHDEVDPKTPPPVSQPTLLRYTTIRRPPRLPETFPFNTSRQRKKKTTLIPLCKVCMYFISTLRSHSLGPIFLLPLLPSFHQFRMHLHCQPSSISQVMIPQLSSAHTALSPPWPPSGLSTPPSYPNRYSCPCIFYSTVSACLRSSMSCRSSALVASSCLFFWMRLENEVRSAGFTFGTALAFHCLPADQRGYVSLGVPETRTPSRLVDWGMLGEAVETSCADIFSLLFCLNCSRASNFSVTSRWLAIG